MGETKKIVVDHYPVENLPEELRRGLDAGMCATFTVELDAVAGSPIHPTLVPLIGKGRGVSATPEEAVDAIRALRATNGNEPTLRRQASLPRAELVGKLPDAVHPPRLSRPAARRSSLPTRASKRHLP